MLQLETFTAFQRNWTRDYSSGQLISDLASVHYETHHGSDSYYYLTGGNDFISPETGQPIRPFVDTTTPIGKKEGFVYDSLYSWANNRKEGLAVWISPPVEGLFPSTKIILHEITKRGGERAVLNRAILADINTGGIIDIANRFSLHSINQEVVYSDSESVRSHLFIMKEGQSVVDLLNLFVDDPDLIEQVKSGQDLKGREKVILAANKYATKMKSGATPTELYESMVEDGFIGRHDISCPPGTTLFSELTLNNSAILGEGEYKYVKNCGNCGVAIGKLIGKGYRCPSCNGEYKGC
jgi:hypothetical protein